MSNDLLPSGIIYSDGDNGMTNPDYMAQLVSTNDVGYYLLFGFDPGEAKGGINDLVGIYQSLIIAVEIAVDRCSAYYDTEIVQVTNGGSSLTKTMTYRYDEFTDRVRRYHPAYVPTYREYVYEKWDMVSGALLSITKE
jgi:hypothetical protein